MKITGFTAQKSVKTGTTYVSVFQEKSIREKDGGGTNSIEIRADEACLAKLRMIKAWPVDIEPDLEISSTPSKFGGDVVTFRLLDFEF